MKKISTLFTLVSLILLLNVSLFAQFRVDNIKAWDTQPITVEKDNTASYVIIGATVALVVITIVYLYSTSTNDDIETPEADTTAMLLNRSVPQSTRGTDIKDAQNKYQSPVSIYFYQQPNFLKSNSTNYTVGIRYSF